jgi:hypothetical protein
VVGDQVELVSILHVAGTLDDDVGMRLEQAYQLLAGRHHLAVKDAPLALRKDSGRVECASAQPRSRRGRPAVRWPLAVPSGWRPAPFEILNKIVRERDTAPDYRHFALTEDLYARPFRSGRWTAEAAPTLPVGAAMSVIFPFSVGLWGAIWLATYWLTWP